MKEVLKDVFSSKDKIITPELVKGRGTFYQTSRYRIIKRARMYPHPRQIAMFYAEEDGPISS